MKDVLGEALEMFPGSMLPRNEASGDGDDMWDVHGGLTVAMAELTRKRKMIKDREALATLAEVEKLLNKAQALTQAMARKMDSK